jgi:DMSO reductase anchor subunit
MNTNTLMWTIALFFGCSIAFAAIRRLTQDQGAAVTLLAQVAALVVIIGAVVFIVRRRDRE